MNESLPSPCPACGEPLPPEAPHGLCPRCLLQGLVADPAPPSDDSLEAIRRQFPDLEILELVGVGGMGRVYKARDPLVDRDVALKILSPDRALDPEWTERFTREARALARLNHPHIVQVHRFGAAPQPHLVMEFVDGVNLRQAMQAGGLSAREALVIVPKLCDALHYAHEHGVLHRDIKPENILIDTEGRVKIVDFGLAKLRNEGAPHVTLTQSGAKLGTLAYMAPEQIENPSEVDHRADLYSLGVVLYEMLTGELPLGRFPSPSEASGTDPRLDAVVLKTLEKKRENRFSDAVAMRSGIEEAMTSAARPARRNWNELNYEYRSGAKVGDWPLLHVAFGYDGATGRMKQARGLVAVGNVATGALALGILARGIVAWGVVSMGLFSCGVLGVGLFSLAVLGLALFCASGVVSVAPLAFGVTTVGYIAAGVKAIAVHAADLDGPIDPLAAEWGDRWHARLMTLQARVYAIGLSGLFIVTATAAAMRANWRIFALSLALSLLGPFTLKFAHRTRPPAYGELYQKQEQAREAKEREAAEQASQERRRQTYELAKRWIAEASRTDDPAAKEKAVAEMHAAIGSEDPERNYAGIRAFQSLGEIKMDRAPFRDPLRRLVANDLLDWEIRRRAIEALFTTDFEASDAETILAMVETAPVEHLGSVAGALGVVSKQDFTGAYAAPMLRILQRTFEQDRERPQTKRPWDTRGVLGALWGARVSPGIESLIVKWSLLDADEHGQIDTAGRGYNVFYFSLSVIANKSSQSVDRLLALARNPDTTNIAGRCLWGLRHTVSAPADRRLVATSVIDLLEDRHDAYLWRQGADLLASFVAPDHLPALRALAAREDLPDGRRQSLEEIIARLSR